LFIFIIKYYMLYIIVCENFYKTGSAVRLFIPASPQSRE